jgi:predicted nucleic acid-binding protein
VGHYTALLDACVLYPAPLRDLLLRLAQTELFRARWTERIHEEWMFALLEQRPDIGRPQLERTRRLMDASVPDCLVSGYEMLVESIALPDPEDRHVLAAATLCKAGVIVTYNLRDFPAESLAPFGIAAQHPDEFISHLFDLSPACVCSAVAGQRRALRRPERTVDDLLEVFLRLELAATVAALEPMRELL